MDEIERFVVWLRESLAAYGVSGAPAEAIVEAARTKLRVMIEASDARV